MKNTKIVCFVLCFLMAFNFVKAQTEYWNTLSFTAGPHINFRDEEPTLVDGWFTVLEGINISADRHFGELFISNGAMFLGFDFDKSWSNSIRVLSDSSKFGLETLTRYGGLPESLNQNFFGIRWGGDFSGSRHPKSFIRLLVSLQRGNVVCQMRPDSNNISSIKFPVTNFDFTFSYAFYCGKHLSILWDVVGSTWSFNDIAKYEYTSNASPKFNYLQVGSQTLFNNYYSRIGIIYSFFPVPDYIKEANDLTK